jgi:hypothetical protein
MMNIKKLFVKVFSISTAALITALILSAIAAWYSIQGLMAIFAAAVIPIIIMGSSLEVAKVVTALWLHRYWTRAGWKLKTYLVPAVIALAFLTSMGIFGYLSKAHSDQSLVSGDVQAKIAIFDERIKTAKETIEENRKELKQLDAQVDQILGRTTDERGADRSVSVRNQQRKDRARINAEITALQISIAKLNEEAAPIRAEVRKVEAEVGPIKYIAALIYGDNPDNNLLERAVRWVIILIVFVFDPLALTLVLAAQSSFEWLEEDLNKRDEVQQLPQQALVVTVEDAIVESKPIEEPIAEEPVEELVEEPVVETLEVATPVEEVEIPAVPEEYQPPVEQKEIKTDGVTIYETSESYVQFEGKGVSKSALQGMRPDLFIARPDSTEQSSTSFGIEFPRFAKKGDIFVRVDVLPNRVFKFDSSRWIELQKEQTDSYLDEDYVRYLVSKIESGEYDIELLSSNERAHIEEYLQQK